MVTIYPFGKRFRQPLELHWRIEGVRKFRPRITRIFTNGNFPCWELFVKIRVIRGQTIKQFLS
jgi:hypothetical protein